MEQVLTVTDTEFDPSTVTDVGQLSAEEYLAYVRFEAEQCPAVVRAEVDSSQFTSKQTRYMPQVEEIPPCPEAFLPSSDWEQDVVVRFSKFRQVIPILTFPINSSKSFLLVLASGPFE